MPQLAKRNMLLSNFLTKAVVTTTLSPRRKTDKNLKSQTKNEELPKFSESLTDKEIMDRLGVNDHAKGQSEFDDPCLLDTESLLLTDNNRD